MQTASYRVIVSTVEWTRNNDLVSERTNLSAIASVNRWFSAIDIDMSIIIVTPRACIWINNLYRDLVSILTDNEFYDKLRVLIMTTPCYVFIILYEAEIYQKIAKIVKKRIVICMGLKRFELTCDWKSGL